MKIVKLLTLIILSIFVISVATSCNDSGEISSIPSTVQKEKQYGNTPPSNQNDSGRAVELDGYLYYAEGYLSKVKLDGTEITRCRKDWSSIYQLNAYKDWLYCTLTFEQEPEKNGIYRFPKDLSRYELIQSGDIKSVLVYGDEIYYSKNGSLCKCRTDGSEETVILNRSGPFQPYGEWIYIALLTYNPERPIAKQLYRVKEDGTDLELFLDVEITNFYIYDNKVLYNDYVDDSKLYCVDLVTKSKEKIIDDTVNSFFYRDNNIYFRKSNDMYAFNMQEKTTLKISNTFVYQEAIAGDYLYFQPDPADSTVVARICIKDGVIGEQTTFILNPSRF